MPAFQRLDLNKLRQTAANQARENVAGSVALENEFLPGLQPLRQDVWSSLRSSLNNPMDIAPVTMTPLASNPLWKQAYDQAAKNLALGGALPSDVRDLVARTAAGRAGQQGLRGGGIADVAARDLGLTSLDLQNQRIAQAGQFGQAQAGMDAQQQALEQSLKEFNANLGLGVQQANRANQLGIASLVTNTAMPVAGLDPGQIASAMVSDVNALNAYNQQAAQIKAQQASANDALFGNLLGLGLGAAFAPLTGGASLAGAALGGVKSLFSTPNPFAGASPLAYSTPGYG